MNTRTAVSFVSFFVAFASLLAFSYISAATTGVTLPNAEGTYLQWTPKSGSIHYTMVDESVCNGTTDYNSTTVVGNRDSYKTFASSTIPNGATITQIDIKPCASRNNGGNGSATLNVFYRIDGVDSADQGNYALGAGTTPVELATTSFTGLAIDKTSSSTVIEIGAVYSAGTKGVRLSRVAAVFTYTPLLAPSSLTGSATTTSAVGLTWVDNATNEDGFFVERSVNQVNWTRIATTSPNVVSYYDSGLTASTTYYYRIQSYNGPVASAYSNTATVSTGGIPLAPSLLVATASTTALRISLTWVDNASNESLFRIERSTTASSSYALIATTSTNTTSYNDNTVATGVTYYYQVVAENSFGSAASNEASATSAVVPAVPTNLFGTAATSTNAISLTWTDNATNELKYAVERSLDGLGFNHIATTSVNIANYYDPGLATTTTYYHRVRAWNNVGYSAYSNTATTTTF